MAVGRANTVLSVKTARTEAVKAGLRMAMAEPTRLYDACGPAGGHQQRHVVDDGHEGARVDQVLQDPEGFPRHRPGQVRLGGRTKGASPCHPGCWSSGMVARPGRPPACGS